MSTPRSIVRSAHEASEILDRVLVHLLDVLEDLEDGWSGVRATSYDLESSGVARPWCATHHRDLLDCEVAEATGCEIGADPDDARVRPDPTGEAAIGEDPDRVRYRAIEAAVERVRRVIDHLDREVLAASRQERNAAAAAIAARRAAAQNAKPAGCACCARVGNQVPIKATGTVGGILDQPEPLCQACIDFVRSRLRLPTVQESEHHRRHGKGWPKMSQTERLRIGAITGTLPP